MIEVQLTTKLRGLFNQIVSAQDMINVNGLFLVSEDKVMNTTHGGDTLVIFDTKWNYSQTFSTDEVCDKVHSEFIHASANRVPCETDLAANLVYLMLIAIQKRVVGDDIEKDS